MPRSYAARLPDSFRTVHQPGRVLHDVTVRRLAALAALPAVLAAALALAPPAGAHARLLRTFPEDGAVLDRAPSAVRVAFDDAVRPAPGNDVVRNADGRSVLAAKPHVESRDARILVLPLGTLRRGGYTVRWRIVSDDGHLRSGVLAFAVGRGEAPPKAVLGAGGGDRLGFRVVRWLFYAGLLVGAGVAAFAALVRIPLCRGRPALARRAETLELGVIGASLGVAALALIESVEIEPAAWATRFGRAGEVGAAVAGAAAVLALHGLVFRRLARAALVLPPLLLGVPAAGGHAWDPGQPRALAVVSDVLHLGAAAFWIGGLLSIGVLVPAAARAAGEAADVGDATVRRYSALALPAVALLLAAGIARTWTELSGVGDLWSTTYGALVLAKIGLLAVLVVLGGLARRRLAAHGLRAIVAAELVLLAAVLGLVAVLTDVAPARNAGAQPVRAAPPRGPVVLPPRDAVVLAGEDDELAVTVGASPRGEGVRLQVGVLGPDGKGVDRLGVRVSLGGRTAGAAPCGFGCYAATLPRGRAGTLRVRVARPDGRARTLALALPAAWPAPPAPAIVARAARVFRALRSVSIRERLGSSAKDVIHTRYLLAAPNILTYDIAGGPKAIVIGDRRWDRDPGGPWVESGAQPGPQPEPFWGTDPVTNAHLLRRERLDGRATQVVSFLDRSIPAWFTIRVDAATGRMLELEMTATAHFMRHRYSAFDAPVDVRPPRTAR